MSKISKNLKERCILQGMINEAKAKAYLIRQNVAKDKAQGLPPRPEYYMPLITKIKDDLNGYAKELKRLQKEYKKLNI